MKDFERETHVYTPINSRLWLAAGIAFVLGASLFAVAVAALTS